MAPPRRRTARPAARLILLSLVVVLASASSKEEKNSGGKCRARQQNAAGADDGDEVTTEECRAEFTTPPPRPGNYEYCVVGAGPGGLQVASMLREANISSVVVFDKAPRAGQFFARFPVHRKLISINKKFFGPKHFAKHWSHPEFQLRHDWNSLIRLKGGVPPGLKFGDLTDDYYPHADVLVQYLQRFADAMLPGAIAYNTAVKRIVKRRRSESEVAAAAGTGTGTGEGSSRTTTTGPTAYYFDVETTTTGTTAERWRCGKVIVATGLSKPNRLPDHLHGPEVVSYHELEENPGRFRGQRVAIFGGFASTCHPFVCSLDHLKDQSA